MSPQLYFIVLNSDIKKRIICDLTEKCYNESKKIVLYVQKPEEAEQLDNVLWTWKQSSFIPHVYVSCMDRTYPEPVVITNDIAENSDFQILLMVNPSPGDIIQKFRKVIDFAEKYDVRLLEASRERFRAYKAQNVNIHTLQPGEFMQMNLD